jgi:hypothetical protein
MTTSTKVPAKAPTKTPTKTLAKVAAKTVAKPVTMPTNKAPELATKVSTVQKKAVAKTTAPKVVGKPPIKNPIEKPIKAKKVKLVRDSFTIPKPEYLILDNLKLRAADLKHPVKKSELLRAGIKALAAMTDEQLLLALKAVPMLKTGRPSK